MNQLETKLIKYVLYARKSSESDELQALSIDSQIKEMKAVATKEGLDIRDIRTESHSAKDSSQRPVFNQVLTDIENGVFSGIICWAPDRLSRNAGDLGRVVDLMDQGLLVDIRTHGQRFTNSPNEKFLLMILGSQAKLENDHKGENVKRGLRAKCAQGWRPGVSPVGYVHDKYADKGQKRVLIDPIRAPIVREMFEKVAYKEWTGRKIHQWLIKEKDFTTKNNKRLSLSRIYKILKDPYYYGEFEYPVGGGVWYTGKHDSIITKELYLKTQNNLKAAPKRHPGIKECNFNGLFYCGSCGSGICVENKFKKRRDGNVYHYIYYHCTRSRNFNCNERAIREEELIRQLQNIISIIGINKITIKENIKKEIVKYRNFIHEVLGKKVKLDKEIFEINIRNYAKFILSKGTKEEQRELLECIDSKLYILNKEIVIK